MWHRFSLLICDICHSLYLEQVWNSVLKKAKISSTHEIQPQFQFMQSSTMNNCLVSRVSLFAGLILLACQNLPISVHAKKSGKAASSCRIKSRHGSHRRDLKKSGGKKKGKGKKVHKHQSFELDVKDFNTEDCLKKQKGSNRSKGRKGKRVFEVELQFKSNVNLPFEMEEVETSVSSHISKGGKKFKSFKGRGKKHSTGAVQEMNLISSNDKISG